MDKTYMGALPTADDIRAARAYIGWSQGELGQMCGLSTTAIANIEKKKFRPTMKNLNRIQEVFFNSDIVFLEGGGFRPRTDLVRIFETREGHQIFFDDVYNVANAEGGDILVSGVDEAKFDKLLGDRLDMHVERMQRLENIHFKVLISESDKNEYGEEYIEYRKIPDEYFASVPFYIYGKKIAVILWGTKTDRIILLNDPELTDAYCKQFNILWDIAKAV